MSDQYQPPSRDYEAEESRRSAMWALVALGIIAVLIVGVMLIFTSGGGKKNNQGQPGPTDISTQVRFTTPTSTVVTPSVTPSATKTSRPPTISVSALPTSTANPCPSTAQCAVPGDAGQAIASLNQFRVSHGQRPVPGSVSAQAQQCALAHGDGPTCAPSYSWEPVPTQDGPKVISLIAGRGDGVQWLLDPTMTSFSVGWAYVPSGTGGGQYECAILKARSTG